MLLKQYLVETILALAVAFMALYPPAVGAVLFGLALASIFGLKALDQVYTRNDEKLEREVKRLGDEVQRLILRGGR